MCNPTNPVGSVLDRDQLLSILENYTGIIAIDECYIEFSSSKSYIELLSMFPNLVIIRTFSKAWGLAGVRGGAVIASDKVINTLNCIKSPFSLSQFAHESITRAIDNVDSLEEQWITLISERERLYKILKTLNCVRIVYVSQTNFLLVNFHNPDKVMTILLEHRIVVRNFTHVLKNCLRISLGTQQQNNILIQVLQTA